MSLISPSGTCQALSSCRGTCAAACRLRRGLPLCRHQHVGRQLAAWPLSTCRQKPWVITAADHSYLQPAQGQ